MSTPRFWRRGGNPVPRLLASPLSLLWLGGAAIRRAGIRPWRAPVPVICVGNIHLGGTGKTPAVRMIAQWFSDRGYRAGVLSRGYGGSLSGGTPLMVDPASHTADEVGDEPLLHAIHGPVVICSDRAAGARLLAQDCDLIIMDDGHQNPSLAKDLSLIVAQASEGFGNGAVVPAGPLRETIASGLARANAIIAVGEGIPDSRIAKAGLPLIRARLKTDRDLKGERVFGFCGIGRPEGFRDTLERLGADVAGFRSFPDHHPFRQSELEALHQAANAAAAQLITTEKDATRLPLTWRDRVQILPVELHPDQPETVDRLLQPILDRLTTPGSGEVPPNRSE